MLELNFTASLLQNYNKKYRENHCILEKNCCHIGQILLAVVFKSSVKSLKSNEALIDIRCVANVIEIIQVLFHLLLEFGFRASILEHDLKSSVL